MGGTAQTEEDVVHQLHAIDAAPSSKIRTERTKTLARRHRVYALGHCLSKDDDAYGAIHPNLVVPHPRGYFAFLDPDAFHYKHNLCGYIIDELHDAVACNSGALDVLVGRWRRLARFRKASSGRLLAVPKASNILAGKKLTCHERQACLTVLPYGFGSQCLVLGPAWREPVLKVIRLGQAHVLGMCDQRPLTCQEARMIFVNAGRELYRSLSAVRALVVKHKRHPRKQDWRMPPDILWGRDSAESDTADTAPEEKCPLVSRPGARMSERKKRV